MAFSTTADGARTHVIACVLAVRAHAQNVMDAVTLMEQREAERQMAALLRRCSAAKGKLEQSRTGWPAVRPGRSDLLTMLHRLERFAKDADKQLRCGQKAELRRCLDDVWHAAGDIQAVANRMKDRAA